LSRCYLDTNFLYTHLRARRGQQLGPVESWRARVLHELDGSAVISGLVLDELAHRLVLAWLRDDGDGDPLSICRADPAAAMQRVRRRLSALWRAIDSLSLELWTTDHAVVERAKSLMAKPGLAPRHAFHAAHALEAGCEAIASSDPGFDRVAGLLRLGPDEAAGE
jgi:predicted nucleic acid-binding protein